MIINFSVENFGSIKDRQTLSFLADKSIHLEDYYIIEPIKGLRLNKLALIYGANASGKTTVLKALNFLREISIRPFEIKTEKFDFDPFLFDKNKPNENTKFELDFVQDDRRYTYSLELNKNYIANEKLINYNPNKALVFERTTDAKKELTSIKFGSKILKKRLLESNLEIHTLWNNTVLGAFLKANVDSFELRDVSDWFERNIMPVILSEHDFSDIVTNYLYTLNNDNKADLEIFLNLFKKADFNITNILFEKQKNNQKDRFTVDDILLTHKVGDSSFNLNFNKESLGTQKYFSLIGLLMILLFEPAVLPVDELESSLHPDLFNQFLLFYLVNSKEKSQLIATTHNREVLNNRDLFRDDAIWFTDKNEDSATELYSLSDFDSSVVRDTSNVLNIYRSGKLGGVPNLGDYYIDLEDEE